MTIDINLGIEELLKDGSPMKANKAATGFYDSLLRSHKRIRGIYDLNVEVGAKAGCLEFTAEGSVFYRRRIHRFQHGSDSELVLEPFNQTVDRILCYATHTLAMKLPKYH